MKRYAMLLLATVVILMAGRAGAEVTFGFGGGAAWEYYFRGFDSMTTPYAGVGASMVLERRGWQPRSLGEVNPPQSTESYDHTFGGEFFVGQRVRLGEFVAVNGQVGGRWTRDTEFQSGGVSPGFTGLEGSLFFEVRFPDRRR